MSNAVTELHAWARSVDAQRQRRAQENEQRLNDALIARHVEAHELIDALLLRIDSVPATKDDGATWGDAGDLGYIVAQLRNALGRE